MAQQPRAWVGMKTGGAEFLG